MICTCDQCDSPFCALQLTALIKPDWGVLLDCFVCLYHSLELVQPSWIAVPCPTTKLSLFICKPFVRIKQGVIRVALKTLLKNKVGNLYLQNFTSASARWLCWFYIKLSRPHFTTNLCPCPQINSSYNLYVTCLVGVTDNLQNRNKCLLQKVWVFLFSWNDPHGHQTMFKWSRCECLLIRLKPGMHFHHAISYRLQQWCG